MSGSQRRLWLTAGWLLVGHVVLTFAGAAFQPQLNVGASAQDARRVLVDSSLTTVYAGLFLELLAALVFLFAAQLFARLLRGDDETSGWLAGCVGGSAVVYVAVQVAASAAGAAALYEGHHGVALSTVTTLNDVRGVGFAASGGVAGALVIAASGAALVSRRLPRWFAWAGVVVGIVCVAAVPAVEAGAAQTLLWFLWLLVAGVVAIRRPRGAADVPATPRTTARTA